MVAMAKTKRLTIKYKQITKSKRITNTMPGIITLKSACISISMGAVKGEKVRKILGPTTDGALPTLKKKH